MIVVICARGIATATETDCQATDRMVSYNRRVVEVRESEQA